MNMIVTKVTKSNLVADSTVVRIAGVTDESDRTIRTLAYHAAGETPDSCYGATVNRYDDEVVVYVHKD